MTVYTTHADALFDPNAPILGSTHLEARDNLLSVIEASPDGLIAAYSWQIEDGAGGTDPIYDFSVDGAVAEIETTVFESGWEYALLGESVSLSDSGSLEFQVFRAANSTYSGLRGVATVFNALEKIGFFTRLIFPMWSRDMHFVDIKSAIETGNAGAAINSTSYFYYSGGTTITKAKLVTSGTAATIDGGKVYLLKRAEYGGR